MIERIEAYALPGLRACLLPGGKVTSQGTCYTAGGGRIPRPRFSRAISVWAVSAPLLAGPSYTLAVGTVYPRG